MYNCLAADTIVHTADGDFQIQELVGKEGRLQTYDEVSKIFRCAPFCNVHLTRRFASTVTIRLGDELSVRCTPDHKFLEKTEGWIPAAMLALKRTSRIKTEYGWSKVLSIEENANREDVFDLEVPETHNYVVNGGIVCHNCRYAFHKIARYYSPWD